MRILLIPPLGDIPWASERTLVEALRAQGNEVVVADVAGGTFPHPGAYMPDERQSESFARFLRGRGDAYVAFLRELRQALTADVYDLILTWQPFWAIATRAVRPRATRVAWVMPERGPTRRRHAVERHATSLVVDTVVVADGRRTLANLGRQVIASPIDTSPASSEAGVDGTPWVVFGNPAPSVSGVVLVGLEFRRGAAASVIVDGRGSDGAFTETDQLLQQASGAADLDLAMDAAWVTRHNPTFVIDPTDVVVRLDHRHRAAFRAGIPVRVPRTAVLAPVEDQVTATPVDGWIELRGRATRERTVDEWASDAVRDPLYPRWEFVERNGKPVLECPACGRGERSEVAVVQRSTTVHRCAACGMQYASPKVPDDLVYTSGYHDGSGMFGSDYTIASWYFDELSDGRLAFLERAGVTPTTGRLVDLGTGIGHFVGRAQAQGWDADGVEISAEAIEFARRSFGIDLIEGDIDTFAPVERYAIATLGQTLEHFVRPGDALDHVREHVLAPRGWLYVELPHVGGLPRRLRRANWAHWQSGDHVSFFTRAHLERLLHDHGFDVVASETITFPAPGAIGTLYSLGLFDATTSWGSAIRLATRWARSRVPLLPQKPISLASEAPPTTQSGAERLLKFVARSADRAGLGDHIRVVARVR